MEGDFVKRIKTGPPQEQVGKLQVRTQNHPGDRERKHNHIGNASRTHNLANSKQGKRRNRKDHHLTIVTAIEVGEEFRRERIKHAEEPCPPAVPRQVPGKHHGAHEGHPQGQDKLEANGAGRVHQELHPHQRMVGVGEQGVDGRHAAQAGIVPFREYGTFGAQNAATDTVQLVAVEHELVRVEGEIAKHDQQDSKENGGNRHEKCGFLI